MSHRVYMLLSYFNGLTASQKDDLSDLSFRTVPQSKHYCPMWKAYKSHTSDRQE